MHILRAPSDLVKDSVAEHDTITHITELFQAAEDNGYYAFISPHYYYPHDKDWEIEGTIEVSLLPNVLLLHLYFLHLTIPHLRQLSGRDA